jgi:endonuclease/exonuclease/phosphatase family metal-dependent hydrolase
VVVALGPVGHIYFNKPVESAVITAVADRLANDHQVPAALVKNINGGLVATTCRGSFKLPAQAPELFGAQHPYLTEVTEDLQRLCNHEDAGDIVLLGCVHGITPVSFPVENGAHAGAGPVETAAFALIPEDTVLDHRGEAHTRPLTLHRTAMRLLSTGITPQPIPEDTSDGNAIGNPESEDSNAVRASGIHLPDRLAFLPQQTLRVMTYNVHSCIGMDGIASPERIARVISRYRPDVIALQELDVSKARSKRVDQARRIAELLDMKFHFHPALVAENELYGDAILSRLPMRLIKAGSLHQPFNYRNSEIRGALWVELDFYGEKIQLLNTHLGLLNREREVQIEELTGTQWLGHPDCRGAVVFCGDLNAMPGAAVLKPLRDSLNNVSDYTSAKANAAKTFSSRVPIVQIDHIFISKALKTVSVSVPGNALTRVASDHLPLIASLQLDL